MSIKPGRDAAVASDGVGGRSADLIREQAPATRERDLRARRTVASLHQVMLDLVEDRPIGRITIDDIVERAGVGRSTFYRHFATKEALVEDIAQAEIDRLGALTIPLLDDRDTRIGVLELARQVDRRRRLWTALLTGGAAPVMKQRFIELARVYGAGLSNRGAMRIPLDLGAAWGVAATFEVLAWWLRQPDPAPIDEVAYLLERLAVRPALDLD